MNNDVNTNRYDRVEQRRQRREERRELRGGAGWIGGAMILLLGLILLAQNMNLFVLQNWWALFILLPAIGSFTAAWRMVNASGGHFTRYARSAVIGGTIFTLAAGMFLFNLDWSLWGPVLLVLVGLGLLGNALIPE